MTPIFQQRFRDQRKSKIMLFLFLEAPFLRGFYFVKLNFDILKFCLEAKFSEQGQFTR